MNLETLTVVASTLAGDPQQTRYSGQYTRAINLSQQQFALDSKCLWKDWPTTTITASDASYALPSDFMWEKAVMLNGLKLDPISRAELARVRTGDRWDDDTGTPKYYIIDPDVSKSQLLLYPIPTSNEAGQDLVLTYYPLPADLSNSTDIPFNTTQLLAQFHIGVAAWAAWFVLQGEQVTSGIKAKKDELMQIYNDQVSLAVDTFKNTVSEPLRMRGNRH